MRQEEEKNLLQKFGLEEEKDQYQSMERKWLIIFINKIYKQPYKDFYKNLSIVDCLMNCGKNKEKFLNY